MSIQAPVSPVSPACRSRAAERARHTLFITGVATVVALIGGAALYAWFARGGIIAFDLAAMFCA
jgi:hypothetical protein